MRRSSIIGGRGSGLRVSLLTQMLRTPLHVLAPGPNGTFATLSPTLRPVDWQLWS
jgi:hypothetical protein